MVEFCPNAATLLLRFGEPLRLSKTDIAVGPGRSRRDPRREI